MVVGVAHLSRLTVLEAIRDTGLLLVLRQEDIALAKKTVAACVTGGAKVIVFDLGEGATPETFLELSRYCAELMPGVVLGAGPVADVVESLSYIAAGARFITSSVFNSSIARSCNARKTAYLPLCRSLPEIACAEEGGAEFVIIRAEDTSSGLDFVRSLRSDRPQTSTLYASDALEPTEERIAVWFASGVSAVALSTSLIRHDLAETGDWDALADGVARLLDSIRVARGEPLFVGLEHVGLSPTERAGADVLSEWYRKRFGLALEEGKAAFFLGDAGSGRIEVVKEPATGPCHIAVRVSAFERAVAVLRSRGVPLEEPRFAPGIKAVYLKETDPAGNRVHLIWLSSTS